MPMMSAGIIIGMLSSPMIVAARRSRILASASAASVPVTTETTATVNADDEAVPQRRPEGIVARTAFGTSRA